MTLKKHIDNIRNELERRQFTSETAVRLGIIDPLLKELGWPTSKTQVVFPEYTVVRGKVDYALCHPFSLRRSKLENLTERKDNSLNTLPSRCPRCHPHRWAEMGLFLPIR